MKKLILVLGLIYIAGLTAFAQSLSLTYHGHTVNMDDTLVFYEDINFTNELKSHIMVHNETNNALNVLCKKTELSIINGSINYFCWAGTCFGPATIISPSAQNINANDSTYEFTGDYLHNNNLGASFIRYTFYDETNADDSVSFVAQYLITPVGLEEGTEISKFEIYPNPAKSQITIDYDIKSNESIQFNILDVSGKVVFQQQLIQSVDKRPIDISALPAGLYFYTLRTNKGTITTKKLIVQ